ncbi:MAG: TetR/AcrR family transcriptional regulator [Nitrosomonadales bacterium]|nr:TetR/AcrR family transcriptional regulator [Nitrosomonadales bacterium]
MTTAIPSDTHGRLLQATTRLMWERSFQAVSVDDLCARAEAKKGSFYHFFPSKIDLAIAAIENSWEQTRRGVFEPIFGDGSSGLAQLQRLIDMIDEYQSYLATEKGAYLGCPFGNLGQEMARQDDRIRVTLQKIFDAHCGYLEAALTRAEQAGEIQAGNNRERAKKIFALLEGAFLMGKVANDPQVFRSIAPAVMLIAASE